MGTGVAEAVKSDREFWHISLPETGGHLSSVFSGEKLRRGVAAFYGGSHILVDARHSVT